MTNGDPSLLGRLQYELAKQPDIIVRYIPIARRYLFTGIVLLYTIDWRAIFHCSMDFLKAYVDSFQDDCSNGSRKAGVGGGGGTKP